jgi:hypothetical protein
MQKLKFHDVWVKKSFETSDYELIIVNGKRGKVKVAIATSPYTGNQVKRMGR